MRHRNGRLALALGLTAIGIAPATAHVAQALVTALGQHGLNVRLVETTSTADALQQVEAGMIDLAVVSGSFRIERYPGLRPATPLYVAALHLLVKGELADDVAHSIDALRGRTLEQIMALLSLVILRARSST